MKPGKSKDRKQDAPPDAEVKALLALYHARRFAEAEIRAHALLKSHPVFGFGWAMLGSCRQMQGKDALGAYQKAAELLPGDAQAQFNLGNALKNADRLDDAAASYRRAIKLDPELADAHGGLAYVLKQLGQSDAAIASCQRWVALKPGNAIAHNNLGLLLQEAGQLDAALASYQRAAQLLPGSAEVHNNLGHVQKQLGLLEAAEASCRRAVELKPDYAEAHNNLGVALKELGRLGAAQESYQRALQIKPDYAEAHNNLGNLLREAGQLHASLDSYRKAVSCNPDYAEAHSNLAIVLKDLGRNEAALASNRRALELKPDFVDAQTNLLFLLNATAGYDAAHRLEEARKFGRMVGAKVASRYDAWQCEAAPQKLRVGIVSGDLHNHPVGYALKSFLAFVDPARVELFAYSNNHLADEFTAGLKPYFAKWNVLYGMSDEAAARLIHDDGVHVLLDLSGHTGKNRLALFAWKPAPVQASWLGYFATTGVAEMDYVMTTEVAVPKAHQGQYTEKLWYLPDTWLSFTPPETDLPVSALPAEKNGHITFACFQRLEKLGEAVLPAWSEILAAVPGSRLLVAGKQLADAEMVTQFTPRLQQHGIDPARVTLQGPAPSRDAYLARYAEADVMLDSFPYPGVTTTCEALWMGVPTVTLAGDTLLSRQGAGVLAAAGRPEWIADSVTDYIGKVSALAADVPKLAALRAGLRAQVGASPLFDAKRFAEHFAGAMRNMWQAAGADKGTG